MIKMNLKIFFRKKKNKVLISVLILFSIGFQFYANYMDRNFSKSQYTTISFLYNRIQGELFALGLDLQLEENENLDKIEKRMHSFETMNKYYPNINSMLEKSLLSRDSLYLENIDYLININKVEENMCKAYEKNYIDDKITYLYGKSLREISTNTKYVNDAFKNKKNIILNRYYPSPSRRINLLLSNIYIGILFLIYSFFFVDLFYSELKEGYYQLLYVANKSRRQIITHRILTNYLIVISIFLVNLFIIYAINFVKIGLKDDILSYIWKQDFIRLFSKVVIAGNLKYVILLKILIFCLTLLMIACIFTLLNLLFKRFIVSSLTVGLLILVSTYSIFNKINLGVVSRINPIFGIFYENYFFYENNNLGILFAILLIIIYIIIIYILINLCIDKYEFLEDSYDFRS